MKRRKEDIERIIIDIYGLIANNSVIVDDVELDKDSRKNFAEFLRSKIPEIWYRFKKGILIDGEEKLEVKLEDIDIRKSEFKNNYEGLNLEFYRYIEDFEGNDIEEYVLKEGYRYMSLDEMRHVINLIHIPENTSFLLGVDIWQSPI